MGLDEIVFNEGQIKLECSRLVVSPFFLVIVAIISGLIAPNWQGRYFSLGWGLAWEHMAR